MRATPLRSTSPVMRRHSAGSESFDWAGAERDDSEQGNGLFDYPHQDAARSDGPESDGRSSRRRRSRRGGRGHPVKWRGGAVPPAPKYTVEAAKDPRRYEEWVHSLEIWCRLVKEFLPKNEQTLRVLEDFDGDAKKEIKWNSFGRYDCEEGLHGQLHQRLEAAGREVH